MFFDIFIDLCRQKGVSKQRACMNCGLSRTAWNKWKSGTIPTGETLQAFADYFGVTTDYLLNGEETKKAPAQEGERQINDEDIKVALFKGNAENITDEMWEEVKRYANYLLHQKENKNKEDQK